MATTRSSEVTSEPTNTPNEPATHASTSKVNVTPGRFAPRLTWKANLPTARKEQNLHDTEQHQAVNFAHDQFTARYGMNHKPLDDAVAPVRRHGGAAKNKQVHHQIHHEIAGQRKVEA